MEQERCIVCLESESLVVTIIHFDCFKECLECNEKRTCPHCRVYCFCQPKVFSNKQEYETFYKALGVPLLYRLTRVYGQPGFSFYHKHCDLSVEGMVTLAKSRDWVRKEKEEEERQAARAAERQRRAKKRAEEVYVFTLRFANTLEQAGEGRRAEDVNEEEWDRLQRVTGCPRVFSPPAGWREMRQTDRAVQQVIEELERWNIDYQVWRPE